MKPVIWVLFDLDNRNEHSSGYLWWFETRKQAREHKKHQEMNLYNARLSQPQKWVRSVLYDPK